MITISSFLFLLLCPFFPAPTVQAQDNTKAAVVRIENSAREEVGAGFIVKIVGDQVYIVTAAHVVRGNHQPKIYLFTRPTRPLTGTVIDREDDDVKGLALLRLTGNAETLSGLTELKLRVSDDLGNGDSIKFIGFPDSTSLWTVDSGTVKRLEGRNLVLSGAARPGHSGGPVILNQLVVGLVTDVTQSDVYAVRAEVLVPYVNGFVSNLIKISDQKNSSTSELCQTLTTLIDSSKGGFYSIVGGATNQEGTFSSTVTLQGAVTGYVRPGKTVYYYLSVQQDKGKAGSLFYTSIANVRLCLSGWEESESRDSIYRYHRFKQRDARLVVTVYYNPAPENGTHWVVLALDI